MQPSNPTPPTTPDTSPRPSSVTPKNQKRRNREGWKSALSTIGILIAAPLVALALTAFVFQSYEVDGPSMETTLHNQDRLIVLKVQRTWSRLTGHAFVPNRGDVIIFVEHNLQQFGDTQSDKQLIKRVIGLPGDRVVVRDGKITIYNATNPKGFDPDASNSWGNVIQTTSGDIDITVNKDQVFVCGDNRVNSLDSRYFGPVPAKDIVGKLIMRVFPLNQSKTF